jgi:hypothetical protein
MAKKLNVKGFSEKAKPMRFNSTVVAANNGEGKLKKFRVDFFRVSYTTSTLSMGDN